MTSTKSNNSKTIKEWLSSIKDKDIRSRALSNMMKSCATQQVNSLDQALEKAFVWKMTPEKHTYWEKICMRIRWFAENI